MIRKKTSLFVLFVAVLALFTACGQTTSSTTKTGLTTEQVAAVSQQIGALKATNNGSYLVKDGLTDLNATVNSAPYATNTPKKSNGQLGVANALLNSTTRQYKKRSETTFEGKSNDSKINPPGWKQKKLKDGTYLYQRGHLLAYALVGGLKHFDASESNPDNIATQTAWANANSDHEAGQNYWEGLVRQALDKHKTVRYRVTPIYANATDKVPLGNHLEAKSKDGSLEFNVFIPNIQVGVTIDYASGEATE